MKIKTKRGARRIRNQRVVTRRFVTNDMTGDTYIVKHYKLSEGKTITRVITPEGASVIKNGQLASFLNTLRCHAVI